MVMIDKQSSTVAVSRELLEVVFGFVSSQADAFPLISLPRGLRSEGLDHITTELRAILAAPVEQQGDPIDAIPVSDCVELTSRSYGAGLFATPHCVVQLYRHAQPTANARVEALESLCAELYQVLGALDAPENVLDKASAAANGETIPDIELLPFVVEAPAKVLLPDRADEYSCDERDEGWNACLDEVVKLNGVKP